MPGWVLMNRTLKSYSHMSPSPIPGFSANPPTACFCRDIQASLSLFVWSASLGPPSQTCPPAEIAEHTSTSPTHQFGQFTTDPNLMGKTWSSWRKGSVCHRVGINDYCVYMQSSFNKGQGISLVATSSTIDSLSKTRGFVNRLLITLDDSIAPVAPGILQTRPIKDKGLGVVAAGNTIKSNTKVMVDMPALMIDPRAFTDLSQELLSDLVTEAADMLPTASGDAFYDLSGGEGLPRDSQGRALAIIGKNAFRTKIGEQLEFHTVFLNVSRVNHACSPNVAYYFDPITMRKSLYAVQTIYPGEELTIGYVDLTQPSQTRQSSLSYWNFTCSCSRCTQPSRRLRESDDRTAQLLGIRNKLDQYDISLRDGQAMAELLIALYEIEGLEARIHEAYYRAAIEFNGVENRWKATKFARLCLDRGLLLKDETRPFVVQMRSLVEHPEGHWSWGFRLVGEQ
ncbi:hypothetical protein QBC36DRAFT_350120 [Triangularia setosa]|uniref:SET domain-containing protein n=1 Tax=Triangularia setosa TaxID=2587417 RepID=A0AAN7A460_9PEZI|nr:hypothetical protein QBC36DRAFT_350120 [Podospora setosa]